jgi:hypothetical protein
MSNVKIPQNNTEHAAPAARYDCIPNLSAANNDLAVNAMISVQPV